MSFLRGTEEYYQKFIELQEKLRKSEEERLILEMKFNEMVQVTREEEQTYYRKLRHQYKRFLEEDRKRQERNERIMRILERIESRAAMLAAKTERFEDLRQQYQAYLQRVFTNMNQNNEPIQPPDIPTISEEKSDLYDHPIVRKAIYGDKFDGIPQTTNLNEHPTIKKALSGTKKEYKSNTKLDVVKQYLHSLSLPISGEEVLKTARSGNKISSHSPQLTDSNSGNSHTDDYSYYKTNAGTIADQIITSINSRPRLSSPYHDKYASSTFQDKDRILESNFCGTISPRRTMHPNSKDVEVFDHQGLLEDSQYPKPDGEIDFVPKISERTKRNEVRFQNLYGEKDDRMPEIPKISIQADEHKSYEENQSSEVKDLGNYNNFKEEFPKGNYNIEQAIENSNGIASTEIEAKNQEFCIEEYKEQLENIEASVNENITLRDNEDYPPYDNESHQDVIMHKETESIDEEVDEDKEYDELEPKDNYAVGSDDVLHIENPTQSDTSEHDINDELHEQPVEITENIALEDYNQNKKLYEENVQPALEDRVENLLDETNDNFQPDTQFANPNLEPLYDNKDNIDLNLPSRLPQTSEIEASRKADIEELYSENKQPMEQNVKNGSPTKLHENETYDQHEHLEQVENNQPIRHEGAEPTTLSYEKDDQPILQYDGNEQPITQYNDGELTAQYDQNVQPVVEYDENGQPIMQYDRNNQPANQYDENGQPIIQYDENGQPIIQYDENGQPIIQYDDHSQPFIQYDEHGQPLMQYDEHGQPIMQYDEHGQPLMQYDENGQPLMQYDGGQPIMQYDENGQSILYNNYDANGQPIYEYGHGEEYYPENQNYEEKQHFDEPRNVEESELKEEEVSKEEKMADSPKQPELVENSIAKEKKSNVLEMLDTDTDSVKQDTKVSNDSDFDFSNN